MPIYTKGGDAGETGLAGNQRVSKTDLRVEAYGSVDELSSFLGLLRCEPLDGELDRQLREIQETLFEIGADLAAPGARTSIPRVQEGVTAMEGLIDRATEALAPLRSFILPGGHREAALLHVARTVCRRAERRVWALTEREPVPGELGMYLNRLSDLLFTWARRANHGHGIADVPWRGRRADGGTA